MKVRSKHFWLSGGIGGLVGFVAMEIAPSLYHGSSSAASDLGRAALYFAGYGLAVGAALGVTEGLVLRRWGMALYGLCAGLVLGALGGSLGGATGQAIQNLAPVRLERSSNADIVITVDSSGSMRELVFFGNDPFGRRKKAARKLVDRLGTNDRVAIVDFDQEARLLYPLSFLATSEDRRRAKEAIDTVDSTGGTSLNAGLELSLRELVASDLTQRPQHIIFLTDGVGDFDSALSGRIAAAGIKVHTIGLGKQVDTALLQELANTTGGEYYPVEKAAALVETFQRIFSENILMTRSSVPQEPGAREPLTSPLIALLLRSLSWAAMGLAIGAGQGLRENTREDLRACMLGGLLGGLIGGALFNPITGWLTLGSGVLGRGLADVVVGAFIGGSMRAFQNRFVPTDTAKTKALIALLPSKSGDLVRSHPTGQ